QCPRAVPVTINAINLCHHQKYVLGLSFLYACGLWKAGVLCCIVEVMKDVNYELKNCVLVKHFHCSFV
ncbi:hypothetical protein V7111_01455, partial [Neobacillus niacini]|uniref:hypothetical protein n=1 Tax=Neobacillus niacini TaxID=86668 RepID=UPI002FFE2C29